MLLRGRLFPAVKSLCLQKDSCMPSSPLVYFLLALSLLLPSQLARFPRFGFLGYWLPIPLT